jgi:hypothetical protein
MLPDSFDDFGLFWEQQLGPVLSGGHCFEVSRFALVVKDRIENRGNGLEHFGSGRPIVGSEQRIEETFEVFRVDAIETVHRVGTEVAIHGAGEEYGEFAQDLGIVL